MMIPRTQPKNRTPIGGITIVPRFIAVPLHALAPELPCPFALYIKIMDGKMVLFQDAGEVLTAEQKDTLGESGIGEVYVHEKDESTYLEYCESNLPKILGDPQASREQKSAFAYMSTKRIARDLFLNPKAETVARFKSSVSNTVDFILQDERAIHSLIRMTSYDFTTYTHSINVGIFATGLAQALFFHKLNAKDFRELSVGFFLHDIGKCRVPHDLLTKKGPLSRDEWRIIRQHPRYGCELLSEKNQLTEMVERIIIQHHERNHGRGYPYGLSGNAIHIFSRICCIADVFDALTAIRPYKRAESTYIALRTMQLEMQDEFDPYLFRQFVLLFKQSKILPD